MKTSKLQNSKASVLSLSDFSRIKNTLIPSNNNKEETQRKELESTLKQISQSKLKNWPDSIEMAKKNKLESRKKVFFEKEAEKRKLDEEERKFNELEKQMVVERANKLLFEAQDPVKSFHSKLLLSDVIKEREYQLDIKKRKEEMNEKIEQKFIKQDIENLLKFDLKEMEKLDLERTKREEQMKVVNSQLQESKIKRIKEYQDRLVEGEVIKMKAVKALKEQKEKENEIFLKAKKQQEEFIIANENLEKLKEVKKLEELEEIKKNEEFGLKKQQMVDLRKRKEQENFKEKQDLRQKLIDKQVEYLKNVKNREDEILNKQVKEAEEKQNKQTQEKQRKLNDFKVKILIFYFL